jgi:hypothetical protein
MVIEQVEELQFREVPEFVKSADGTEIQTMKKYIVHKVKPNSDTLFALSYHYKVSMRELQLINGFSGDDIFFMTEMLVPYKG